MPWYIWLGLSVVVSLSMFSLGWLRGEECGWCDGFEEGFHFGDNPEATLPSRLQPSKAPTP